MNLDHDFFSGEQINRRPKKKRLTEDQKKKKNQKRPKKKRPKKKRKKKDQKKKDQKKKGYQKKKPKTEDQKKKKKRPKKKRPKIKHFFPRSQVKTKKKSSPAMEHFFSPKSSGDLRSDAHQSQIIGGDSDEDHTQIIGENTVKLLGGYISPIPPGFRHPWDHLLLFCRICGYGIEFKFAVPSTAEKSFNCSARRQRSILWTVSLALHQ